MKANRLWNWPDSTFPRMLSRRWSQPIWWPSWKISRDAYMNRATLLQIVQKWSKLSENISILCKMNSIPLNNYLITKLHNVRAWGPNSRNLRRNLNPWTGKLIQRKSMFEKSRRKLAKKIHKSWPSPLKIRNWKPSLNGSKITIKNFQNNTSNTSKNNNNC